MDEQRKDRTDVDAHQGRTAAQERVPWRRPQWRKLDAGEAAVNVAGSADVSTIFS
jgi:hypothetical protein